MPKIDPVEGFVQFVQDVKPYHTKVIDVIIEYIHEDDLNVKITEQLDWEIGVDLDRALGFCPEGFGLNPFGELSEGGVPDNPSYDVNSGDYVPALDRLNPAYDPLAEESATEPQKLVSKPFLTYEFGTVESNWDNSDCPPPQEGLVFPTIDECVNNEVIIDNVFCNNYHITYDAIEAYEYNSTKETATQIGYTGSANVGVAKAHFHMDRGAWYWETVINTVAGDTSMFRVGVIEFDPIDIEPPFNITTNEDPVGDLIDQVGYAANGQVFNNGANVATFASYTTGDIIGIAFDIVANDVEFYKNGASQGVISNVVDVTNLRGIFPSGSWISDEDACSASPPVDYKVYSPAVSMELTNSSGEITWQSDAIIPPAGFSLPERNCVETVELAPFVFIVDPSATGNLFTITSIDHLGASILIDWGDGNSDTSAPVTHDYSSSGPGPFTVTIYGEINEVVFGT
jgi:hypothetical protein